MASRITLLLLLALAVVTVDCNSEVDALNAWKVKLVDPNNVLQSWDPTEINPCTWLHVTCNNNNSVVRVDLGNAGLSGPLVPQLGSLVNLQYLMVHGNSISGTIPVALGNLTRLLILGLHHNQLTGPIPASLGKLVSLRFMRLNSNKLTGRIPTSIITLINLGNMNVMNVSDNSLVGRVRTHDSKGFAVTTIIQDPKTPPK